MGDAAGPKRVAIAGNPNTGKTTLFNQLTGSRAKVGNYPGSPWIATSVRWTCPARASSS